MMIISIRMILIIKLDYHNNAAHDGEHDDVHDDEHDANELENEYVLENMNTTTMSMNMMMSMMMRDTKKMNMLVLHVYMLCSSTK